MEIAMASHQGRRYIPLIIGSIILVFGAALTAVEAFNGNVGLATVGFGLTIVGYRISQRTAHSNPKTDRSRNWSIRETIFRYIIALGGIALLGYGGTVGAQTILSLSVHGALIAGCGMVGGYFIMHAALNNTVL
ncbi:hypothetical protein [Halorientalis persicus]|uniref:hypothetical protein n=1 Tax=Halorientalis persicus TaxID=1367881 RepID=UPI0011144B0A|nr:hypothetical protein [Halorientalis persicus]